MQREIVLDTETTGLKAKGGDRLVEIGCVELYNRIPTGREFHAFINPEGQEVHPEADAIHGISNAFLMDKPLFGMWSTISWRSSATINWSSITRRSISDSSIWSWTTGETAGAYGACRRYAGAGTA